MKKNEIQFAIKTNNGVVTAIGKSFILQPKTEYKGSGIKWYEDKKPADAQKGGVV